jgi:type VI secretion system protein ImpA
MINVEELLKPVADDKPCGEDFTYHPDFQKMEDLAKGKAETQFSAAEEPVWKDVREAALDILRQSKHLHAGVVLTRSLLKTGGLDGFRDGLAVLRGITEKYWPDLYPKLDPDDNNDPTERLNTLNSLSSTKFCLDLQQAALCMSPSFGPITLQQYLTAQDKAKTPAEGDDTPASTEELDKVNAAFREAGPDAAKATLTLVGEAITHAQGIDQFLDSTLGAGSGVNFEALKETLNKMKRAVEPFSDNGAGEVEVSAGETSGGERPVARGASGATGSIQSGADVIKHLDLICDYYARNEPSSPVPLILKRAKGLVNKDFTSIITDLTPEALAQLQVITGGGSASKEDK